MSLSSLIEKWDNIAFIGYNIIARILYFIRFFRIHKYLKRNKSLKNIHEGKRCFIVLNGPSLSNFDLSKIKDEISICTNYFYQTSYYDLIKPKYYCATDSNFFSVKDNAEKKEHIDRMLQSSNECKFVFNIKYLENFDLSEKVHVTYSKHMPNIFGISNKLESLSSNFISVSMYAINLAIYLGFTEIYLLGYDFEPGVLSHFYKNSKLEENTQNKQKLETKKEDVCGKYWQYSTAQYQNYYLDNYAIKKGIRILNCNNQSNVKAFDFVNYDDLFIEK